MQRFDELCNKAIKAAHAEPRYQQAVLSRVRQLDQVEANTEEEFLQSNQRVLNNAVPITQEVAFEEEV